jgi:hypothetical protein
MRASFSTSHWSAGAIAIASLTRCTDRVQRAPAQHRHIEKFEAAHLGHEFVRLAPF